jgi:hypothetical protein
VARRFTEQALLSDVGLHAFFEDNAEGHFLGEMLSYVIERWVGIGAMRQIGD